MILGGDMTGKGIQALVEERPGVWQTNYLGEKVEVDGETALVKLETRIRNSGFYPYRMQKDRIPGIRRL